MYIYIYTYVYIYIYIYTCCCITKGKKLGKFWNPAAPPPGHPPGVGPMKFAGTIKNKLIYF